MTYKQKSVKRIYTSVAKQKFLIFLWTHKKQNFPTFFRFHGPTWNDNRIIWKLCYCKPNILSSSERRNFLYLTEKKSFSSAQIFCVCLKEATTCHNHMANPKIKVLRKSVLCLPTISYNYPKKKQFFTLKDKITYVFHKYSLRFSEEDRIF